MASHCLPVNSNHMVFKLSANLPTLLLGILVSILLYEVLSKSKPIDLLLLITQSVLFP